MALFVIRSRFLDPAARRRADDSHDQVSTMLLDICSLAAIHARCFAVFLQESMKHCSVTASVHIPGVSYWDTVFLGWQAPTGFIWASVLLGRRGEEEERERR